MKPIDLGSFSIWPPVMSAPMAGYTDRVFRELLRENGCPFCFTEMVSAKGFVLSSDNSEELMEHSEEDQPLCLQLFGSEPEVLADAARKLKESPFAFEAVDINMGCPARKIVSQGSGGALLKDLGKASAMISALKENLSVPVTAKVRLGFNDPSDSLEVAQVLARAGVDMLSVHGRTVSQGFSGHSHWDWIGRMGQEVPIPVVGNGDIASPQEALSRLEMKGISGVMVGRGFLGNPLFFKELCFLMDNRNSPWEKAHEKDTEEDLFDEKARIKMGIVHLKRAMEQYGEKRGLLQMRKHLAFYVKGLKGASRIRQAIVRENSPQKVIGMLERALANDWPP